ncbi:MAG: glutamate racemase [Myxococcales bacterium]|nr:glutamate racemase [Myxococcales bacterium]
MTVALSKPTLTAEQPIGVFDSGVGGLTVAKAVMARLPHERLIYLGDTARVPYGTRSQATVLRYSRNAARFLLRHSVKLVLIACNTASAAALDALNQELPVGVLGAVEPGAAAAVAATQSGVIGVIGTLATVRSGAYERAIRRMRPQPDTRIEAQACPLLVPLVEEGWTAPDDAVSQLVLHRYLTELARRSPAMDTLVLGCTHYPLLRPAIERAVAELWTHPVTLVDSAQAMAEETARRLQDDHVLASANTWSDASPRLTCFVTDEARVSEVGSRFLGQALASVQLVDL